MHCYPADAAYHKLPLTLLNTRNLNPMLISNSNVPYSSTACPWGLTWQPCTQRCLGRNHDFLTCDIKSVKVLCSGINVASE
ncbi:hypothetical protein E2C01_017332 [Portunus trituberculatus]|uniref:Uncharacterized protein n=1 Tax=Portunus trituberculatus TaxID=210409 RepID=A0A5B7DTB8_PORTR|nr:hypothetical protein [Portunus trituberculatus]